MNACYFDIRWDLSQNDIIFRGILDKYFNKYVCGREISNSGIHHYQLFTDSSKNVFANFKAKVIKKFALIGITKTKGVRRQYGQIKEPIQNPPNMISYCLKDGNYIYKGYSEEYIQERYACSYEKVDKNDKYDKFINKMQEYIDNCNYGFKSRTEKLLLTTKCSQVWKEIYDSYIPKYKSTQILLDLGILGHEDYARNIFSSYIEKDNPPNDPTRILYCENCCDTNVHHSPSQEEINREMIIEKVKQIERDKYNLNQKILKDKFFS